MEKYKVEWDYDKDGMLIDLVKVRPELYDLSLKHYDTNAKKKAWKGISDELYAPEAQCKERWESLRSQHRKYLKKQRAKTGLAAVEGYKWRYEDQMSYLLPFMKERTMTVESPGMEENSIEDLFELTKENGDEMDDKSAINRIEYEENEISEDGRSLSSKRKRMDVQQTNVSNDTTPNCYLTATSLSRCFQDTKVKSCCDTIDKFFSLMAATVKQFSLADQHYIKNKVFFLVSEVEAKYLNEPSCST